MSKAKKIENPMHVLDNLVGDISISIEKTEVLTADILENYFAVGVDTPQQREKAICNYENFYVKAKILMDYVSKLLQEVKELQEVSDIAFDILKNIEVNGNA